MSKSDSSPDDGQYVPSTVEIIDTYCPSYGELYDFDMRRHVLSIMWRAI
jgi:hypothetical protein